MLMPFRLGVGGPLGNGRQYWPWIHRQDWVGLVAWLATSAGSSASAVAAADDAVTFWNATAPESVTSAEFARVLGRVLHRPALLPAPYFALRVVLGEVADSLTTGARVLPAHAEHAGFRFRHPHLEGALRDLLT
jgi:hypothetical protein